MEVMCHRLLSVSYSLNTQWGGGELVAVGPRFLALFQATFHACLHVHYILYIIDRLFDTILLTTEVKFI